MTKNNDANAIDDILATAAALQAYDQQKNVLVTRNDLGSTEGRTLEEMAETFGIKPQYLERAKTVRNPSVEEQIAALRELRAKPDAETILSSYVSLIYHSLQRIFPDKKIDFNSVYKERDYERWQDISICEFKEVIERNLLGKRTRRIFGEPFAQFHLDGENILKTHHNLSFTATLFLYDPVVLAAAGEGLKKLNDFYGSAITLKVIYKYQVALSL